MWYKTVTFLLKGKYPYSFDLVKTVLKGFEFNCHLIFSYMYQLFIVLWQRKYTLVGRTFIAKNIYPQFLSQWSMFAKLCDAKCEWFEDQVTPNCQRCNLHQKWIKLGGNKQSICRLSETEGDQNCCLSSLVAGEENI